VTAPDVNGAGVTRLGHARRSLRRMAVTWIALYLPVHWRTGLKTVPSVDHDRGGTRPSDFVHDRAELVRLVERVAAGDLPTDDEHPYLGRCSAPSRVIRPATMRSARPGATTASRGRRRR